MRLGGREVGVIEEELGEGGPYPECIACKYIFNKRKTGRKSKMLCEVRAYRY